MIQAIKSSCELCLNPALGTPALILALERQRKEDPEFEASLDYMVEFCQKTWSYLIFLVLGEWPTQSSLQCLCFCV